MMPPLAHLLLRASVAFAFIYPPLSALGDPDSWLGYFPSFMHGFVPGAVLLHGFGLVEAVMALWILSGKRIFIPSVLAAVMLLAIVGFHSAEFQILFRDVSIALAAAALAVEAWHKEKFSRA